jgi:hypothetical protein
VLQDFAKHLHWTTAQVLDGHTWAEFVIVWCGGSQRRAQHDPDAIRNKINKRRAELGLPPMKPAPKG